MPRMSALFRRHFHSLIPSFSLFSAPVRRRSQTLTPQKVQKSLRTDHTVMMSAGPLKKFSTRKDS